MNKGFTLVELLAVIVIISLLTMLTVTSVTSIVKNGKEEFNDHQKVIIEKAAELWGYDNLDKMPENNNCIYITLKYLVDSGYIDDIYDIDNGNLLNQEQIKIKINASINESGRLIYKYDAFANSIAECVNIED